MVSESGKSNPTAARKVYVFCNGCPENRIDVARAEKYLVENDCLAVKNWQEADIILFNACGMSQESTRHSLNIIKEFQNQKRGNQQLIIWGCLPKIDPETLRKEYDGIILPGSELSEIPQIFNKSSTVNQKTANSLGNKWPEIKNNMQSFASYQNLGFFAKQIYKRPAMWWRSYIDSRFNLVRDEDPSIFYIKISIRMPK